MNNKTKAETAPAKAGCIKHRDHYHRGCVDCEAEADSCLELQDRCENVTKLANQRLAQVEELLAALRLVAKEMGERIGPAAFNEFSERCKDTVSKTIAKYTGGVK